MWIKRSSAEIRSFAFFSGDPVMISNFRAGKDPYRETIKKLYPELSAEKVEELRGSFKSIFLG